MEIKSYQWLTKDKWLYYLSLIPFLVVFIGTAVLLSTYSTWLTVLLLVFYLIINVFQAGCCIASGIIYPNREFDQKFFDRNAAAGEIMVLVLAFYPIYWVFKTGWYLVPIYLLLIAAHLVIFMPTQCEKCSYNETCPGGIAWRACRLWLERKPEGRN